MLSFAKIAFSLKSCMMSPSREVTRLNATYACPGANIFFIETTALSTVSLVLYELCKPKLI